MEIVEIKFSDFSLVEVKSTNKCKPSPHCKKHGAMNKMNVLRDGGGYWRCISSTSSQNENNCRAGCLEIRSNSL